MQVLSSLVDGRINSTNYLVEIEIGEYLGLVRNVLAQNEFQRRRVSSSKTIYSLLKQDIQRGCVIPPIVLALTSIGNPAAITKKNLSEYALQHRDNLIILDGLQRTYSLIDLESELKSRGNVEALNTLSKQLLRVEIYVGINRLGILYRMLTLNTGQSPMSLRQQIEMLYLDFAKQPFGGITLLREADGKFVSTPQEYNFRDMIEGFNSYLERNELPIERADLLENIKSLEKLAQENAAIDIFKTYVQAWHSFILKISDLTGNVQLPEDFEKEFGTPWGKGAAQVFKKAQAVSGFGAAIGRLKDFGLIDGFAGVESSIQGLVAPQSAENYLSDINKKIIWINNNSKKIGNAQRMYFHYYFRDLFNRESDSFQRPDLAVESAFQKYLSQNT